MNALTDTEIQTLVADWFHKLDVHAPMVEVLPYLAQDGPTMVFPEATLHTLADFERWYQRVISVFFDEVHTPKSVVSAIDGESAEVKVVVEWQTSIWNAPDAASKRIVADADQTWTVKRAPDGRVVISRYVVNGLNYHSGSAVL